MRHQPPSNPILVVDDQMTNRLKLTIAIEKLGHEVIAVADGVECMQALHRQAIDLVLLDLLMPNMSGFDVLKAMKEDEKLSHIPVVVISAVSEAESMAAAIELGAEEFLPKNFNPIILHARVNACLEKKTAARSVSAAIGNHS